MNQGTYTPSKSLPFFSYNPLYHAKSLWFYYKIPYKKNPCSNHPKALCDQDAHAIICKKKVNPKLTAPDLMEYIVTATRKTICAESIRSILRNEKFHGKKPF